MESKIDVLDKGYVKLITWLPWNMVELQEAIEAGDLQRAQVLIGSSDLNTVNAAKASFKKTSTTLGDSEYRLIDYLARNHESSPFRWRDCSPRRIPDSCDGPTRARRDSARRPAPPSRPWRRCPQEKSQDWDNSYVSANRNSLAHRRIARRVIGQLPLSYEGARSKAHPS